MTHLAQSVEKFWHDHAGARFLGPMIAIFAAMVVLVLVALAWPYVS